MSRMLQLVVPVCLVATACSMPANIQPASPADFNLDGRLLESASAGAESTPSALGDIEGTPDSRRPQGGLSANLRADDDWDDDDTRITMMLGQRSLDDDSDWDPVDDQYAVGLEINGYFDDHSDNDAADDDDNGREGGHGYEVGLNYSKDDSSNVEGELIDLYGGYRYTFRPDSDDVHPYLSAGVAVVHADVESDGPGANFSDDDTSPGVYLGVGIGFDVTETARLGLAYRYFFQSDTDIGPIGDSDFEQIMITLGFRF